MIESPWLVKSAGYHHSTCSHCNRTIEPWFCLFHGLELPCDADCWICLTCMSKYVKDAARKAITKATIANEPGDLCRTPMLEECKPGDRFTVTMHNDKTRWQVTAIKFLHVDESGRHVWQTRLDEPVDDPFIPPPRWTRRPPP